MNRNLLSTLLLGAVFLAAVLFAYQRPSRTSPKPAETAQVTSANVPGASREFRGQPGTPLELRDGRVEIDARLLEDGKAHFHNTKLGDGQTVYFFLARSPDGKIRAAANGCQVCGAALEGFRQEGEFVVCNTCGNRYHLNLVATERGGCNPAPINANMTPQGGKLLISEAELAQVAHFFRR